MDVPNYSAQKREALKPFEEAFDLMFEKEDAVNMMLAVGRIAVAALEAINKNLGSQKADRLGATLICFLTNHLYNEQSMLVQRHPNINKETLERDGRLLHLITDIALLEHTDAHNNFDQQAYINFACNTFVNLLINGKRFGFPVTEDFLVDFAKRTAQLIEQQDGKSDFQASCPPVKL